jgi:tetrahydromethanopterin S-methyltransferase subunit E
LLLRLISYYVSNKVDIIERSDLCHGPDLFPLVTSYFFEIVGASGNSHICAYIYLDAYMREHKPRIKGCGQVVVFYVDILVYIFFVDIKKYRPGCDQVNIFIRVYALHKHV